MVQRKAPTKSGIQDDPKPFSLDGRNRGGGGGGAELKKKMKKSSRPTKRENFRPQPGKPPPGDVPIQQKQFAIKRASDDGSPNYMKSTSSSDARKEASNRSALKRSSSARPERTLTRTSSLKRVRNLTKTPSFKPARASATRKCSRAALCAAHINDVQRATCSSTLKESKFPPYLRVCPEGRSVMKVCPYTYCSLNGHQHRGPSPPLKSFVSAWRRLLKTKKSANLDPPSGEEANFFVEIYAKERENEDGDVTGFAEELEELNYPAGSSEEDGDDGREEERGESQAPESVSSGSSWHSEVNLEDGIQQNCCDATAMEKEMTEETPEEEEEETPEEEDQKAGAADDDFPQRSTVNGSESEVTDMDWEEEQFYDSEDNLDTESDTGYGSENESPELDDEPVLEVADTATQSIQKLPVELPEECFEEEKDETTRIDGFIRDDMITSTEKPVEMAAKEETHEISEANETAYEDDQPQETDQNNDESNKLTEARRIDAVDDGSLAADGSPLAETHDHSSAKNNAEGGEPREDPRSELKQRNAYTRAMAEEEELKKFNPKEPNFLPAEAGPEAEKVDLRHQTMDERKNSEEWMLDYALRRTLTKLAPARKRKVALLVEAFESVMPCETTHLPPHPPAALSHSRPMMQACS